ALGPVGLAWALALAEQVERVEIALAGSDLARKRGGFARETRRLELPGGSAADGGFLVIAPHLLFGHAGEVVPVPVVLARVFAAERIELSGQVPRLGSLGRALLRTAGPLAALFAGLQLEHILLRILLLARLGRPHADVDELGPVLKHAAHHSKCRGDL